MPEQVVYAYEHLTSDGAVKSGAGVLHSIVLSAAAGAAATADVYDETSGSGGVICVLTAAAGETESAVLDVAFGVGCYVDITGSGAKVTVAYL